MASPAVTYNAPSFYSDPNYASSINGLNSMVPYATSLMTGQGLPPAYAGLITPNSPQFQQMLQRTTGNILGATQDQMAGQGIGDSGVAASAAAGAAGNATSQLTYQDFLNSQANQLHLIDSGSNIMMGAESDIGSMALTNQGQNNQFNLTNASESLDAQTTNAQMKQQQQQAWAQMISSGIGALGNVAGMAMTGGMSAIPQAAMSFSAMPGAGGSGGGGGFINNNGFGF